MSPDDPREPTPPDEWDLAAIAEGIAASASGPAARRRRVLKKKRHQPGTTRWDDAASEDPTRGDQAVELLEKALWSERQNSAAGRRKRPARRSSRRRDRSPAIWLAVGAAIAVPLLATAWIVAVTQSDPVRPVATGPRQPLPAAHDSPGKPSPDVLEGLEILDSGSPDLDAVKLCISGFFTAPTLDEKAGYLRPTPDLKDHLEAMRHDPLLTLGLEPEFASRFIRSGRFIYAEIVEAGAGVRGVVVEGSPGGPRIDFDSLAGYSEADWEAIASRRLVEPVTTRAFGRLLPDVPAPSPGEVVLAIEDPGRNRAGTAVLEILAIEDERLRRILRSPSMLPYIFEFTPATVAGEPVVRIGRVLTTGWFDEAIFPWASRSD